MIPDRYYLFVPGIRTDVENRNGWHLRAARWIERNKHGVAETYGYHAFALTRWIEQRGHIARCSDELRYFAAAEYGIHLVGHSNGCALLCGILKKCPEIYIDSVHLIAAAESPDFDANGLNEALRWKRVGKVHLYCSSSDTALKLAGWSKSLLGWAGLGYGNLGRVGPVNDDPKWRETWRLIQHWRNDFGHSTWFGENHFDGTMQLIAGL